MSKRTVTMKTLVDSNVNLRMRVHQLECELAAYKARGFWPKLVELVGGCAKSEKGKCK